MKQLLTIIGALGLLLGCKSEATSELGREGAPAGAEQPARAPEPDQAASLDRAELPPPGTYVVIAADAPVFVAADEHGSRLPANPRGVDRTAKVLELRDGFIVVETLDTATARACVNGFEFASEARLRLFVRPDALRPVLTAEHTLTFEDGTQFELLPGVPIRERAKIAVGAHELVATIDVGLQGWWFDAVPARVPVPDEEPDEEPYDRAGLTAGLALRYGEHGLVADGESFGVGHLEAGGLLSFANGCGRFVLRPDNSPAAPHEGFYARDWEPVVLESDASSDSGRPICELEEWLIPALAELAWPGGGEAGVLLREHVFAEQPDTSESRVCFGLDGGVELCVASSAIVGRADEGCALLLARIAERRRK